MSTLALLVQWRRSRGAVALPWQNPLLPLPNDIGQVLAVANGEGIATQDAAAASDATPAELRAAAVAFIREVLHAADATFYRRLAVEPDASVERIRDHYRDLISVFHPDRMGAQAQSEDAGLAASINEAYNTLKHPESRAKYDRMRTAATIPVPPAPAQRRADAADSTMSPPSSRERGQWRRSRVPHPLLLWARRQNPRTLKALAFAALLAVAAGAIWLTTNRDAAILAIERAEDGSAGLRASGTADGHAGGARLPSAVPARALPSKTSDAPTATMAPASRGVTLQMPARPEQSPNAGMPGPGSPPIAERLASPVSPASRLPASGDASEPALRPPTPMPRAREGDAMKVAAADSVEVAAPVSLVEAASRPLAVVAPPTAERSAASTAVAGRGGDAAALPVRTASAGFAGPAPALAAPSPSVVAAVPSASSPPTPAEVDVLVARLAKAYDAGDTKALVALFDTDAARSDRLAFTLATFDRIFHETTARRIDLRLAQRAGEGDGLSVSLLATTTLVAKDDHARTTTGVLTLVVQRQQGSAVITDLRYRERDALP